MDVLENLYNCIEANLKGRVPDWDGFSRDFSNIHKSEFAIYRAIFAHCNDRVMDRMEAIATSAPALRAHRDPSSAIDGKNSSGDWPDDLR